MKKKIITLLVIAFLATSVYGDGTHKLYTNYKLDGAITIDGEMDDWSNIDPVTVTLKPAREIADDNASLTADFYSTHDDSKIYFLIVVKGDVYQMYDLTTCDAPTSKCAHKGAPALGIAFPIDEGAEAEYMGGSGRAEEDHEVSTGEVDIMHWELDTDHGVVTSGTKNTTTGASFGDGTKNLDDEWATGPEDRSDDNAANSENSYVGSWSFTGGYDKNGTAGDWVFEISRKLQTGDPHDAQFAVDDTIEVAIAFWTPNEHTNNKWTDDGHYVNYDSVIEMTIDGDVKPSKEDDSPGFGLILSISGIFVTAAILKKRR